MENTYIKHDFSGGKIIKELSVQIHIDWGRFVGEQSNIMGTDLL
jgi:hypothetical protein